MKHAGQFLLLVALFPALLGACGGADRTPGPAATSNIEAVANDTTELRRIYDAIDTHHEQLMAGYRQMAGQMDGELQQMVDYMAQMHGQTAQMHRGMMGDRGHGMMGRGMHEGGMMGSGMMGRHQTREWDRQMRAMHQQMSRHMRQQGFGEMAAMHEQMAGRYGEAADAVSTSEGEAPAAPQAPEGEVSGQAVYQQYCATCHGADGQGLGGTFPPLAASGWVTGDAETPIRIVLHGLEGPIQVQGTSYDGVMPSFGARLSDTEVAALLNYVRSHWGNEASEVTVEEVRSVRQQYQGRAQPWTPDTVR
jgi:mono/diheme cytochrome c family protein